jgi:small ligand-binding sensory domain FIST
VHPLVVQGCRPVGDPYTTTRSDGNVIFELGGGPPLTRLRELAGEIGQNFLHTFTASIALFPQAAR